MLQNRSDCLVTHFANQLTEQTKSLQGIHEVIEDSEDSVDSEPASAYVPPLKKSRIEESSSVAASAIPTSADAITSKPSEPDLYESYVDNPMDFRKWEQNAAKLKAGRKQILAMMRALPDDSCTPSQRKKATKVKFVAEHTVDALTPEELRGTDGERYVEACLGGR